MPTGHGDLDDRLTETTNCSAQGVICPSRGRPLSNAHSATVSGPVSPETGRGGCFGQDGPILGDRFLTRSERRLKSLPEWTMEPAEATLVCPSTLFLLGQGAAVGQEPSRNRHPGRLMEVGRFQPEAPV